MSTHLNERYEGAQATSIILSAHIGCQ